MPNTGLGLAPIRLNNIAVADEVWIATALLTRELPEREDFSVQEILDRLSRENIYGHVRAGVRAHISAHCCANKPPQPSKIRMLTDTGRDRRRLYRPDDPHHPDRTGPTMPGAEDIPVNYRELIDWWKEKTQAANGKPESLLEALRKLRDAGPQVWQGVQADEYVAALRKDWE
jgi:hypothetical protein